MKVGIIFLVLAIGLIASALYLATDTRANIAPAPPENPHRPMHGKRGDFRGAEKVEQASAGDATTDEEVARQLRELELERKAGNMSAGDFSIESAMANQDFTLTPLQKQVRDAPAIARIKNVLADKGFVVLDSGLDQSLRAGMNLAVRRGECHIVAKLIVGDAVDTSESIANIAPGTIPTGIELRPGDAVIPWADIVSLKTK